MADDVTIIISDLGAVASASVVDATADATAAPGKVLKSSATGGLTLSSLTLTDTITTSGVIQTDAAATSYSSAALADGAWGLHKNTGTGDVHFVFNDGGTRKAVPLRASFQSLESTDSPSFVGLTLTGSLSVGSNATFTDVQADTVEVGENVTIGTTASFGNTYTGSLLQNVIGWNTDYGALSLGLNSSVLVPLNGALYAKVRNTSGVGIAKGTPLYCTGADSGRLSVQAWDQPDVTSVCFAGFAAEVIPDSSNGYSIVYGELQGVTTDGAAYGESWSDGNLIYLSQSPLPGVGGVVSQSAPSYVNLGVNNYYVEAARVLVAASGEAGSLFVKPSVFRNFGTAYNVNADQNLNIASAPTFANLTVTSITTAASVVTGTLDVSLDFDVTGATTLTSLTVSGATTSGSLTVSGNTTLADTTVTGTLDVNIVDIPNTDGGYLKLPVYTVATLPAAGASLSGARAFVSDSANTLSSHHGSVVVGLGSDFVPVYCDGTDWRVG